MKKLISLLAVFTLLLGAVVLPVSASGATLDDHLITHWDFMGDTETERLSDKATKGSVKDNLTVQGSGDNLGLNGDIATFPGKVGGGSKFEYLQAAASNDLLTNNNDRTIYLVYRTVNNHEVKWQATSALVQSGAVEIGSPELKITDSANDPGVSAIIKGGSTLLTSSEQWKVVNNTWMTVAISFSGNSATAYFNNGTKEYTNTVSGITRSTTGAVLNLGASSWSAIQIDDVRIYDKALSVKEIQSLSVVNGYISDNALITHWDFAGNDPLADKAVNGKSSDTLKYSTPNNSLISFADGKAVIKQGTNGTLQKTSFLYASDSSDLLRTTDDRTIIIKFKGSRDDEWLSIASQTGAFHLGRNKSTPSMFVTPLVSSSVNSNITSADMVFVKDEWITVAVSYDRSSTGFLVASVFFKVGDGSWIENTCVKNTNANSVKFYPNAVDNFNTNALTGGVEATINDFLIGKNVGGDNGVWPGNLTYEDVRIYDQALSLTQVSALTIKDSEPTAPSTPDPSTGKVTSQGHSLTLGDNIGVNFFASVSDDIKDTAEVKITKNGSSVFEGKFTDAFKAEEISNAYKFTAEVAAKEMADTLTLTVTNSGATVYTDSFSVKQYIDYVVENYADRAELVSLVKAMANYGAYAQIKLSYNVNNLANAGLAEADKALADVAKQDLGKGSVSGAVTGVSYYGASLDLSDKTHVVFAFKTEQGVTITENSITGADAYDYNATKGNLQVRSEGLCAQNLTTEQVFTLRIGEETISVSYSPMMYIMNNIDHADEKQANLMKALYAYYVAAAAYVAD